MSTLPPDASQVSLAEATAEAGLSAVATRACLLEVARESALEAERAEVRLLEACAQIAQTSVRTQPTVTIDGWEEQIPLGGDGTTLAEEFVVAEVAVELGMSEAAAQALMSQAVELVERLPRVWEAVRAGIVAPWRAKRIAKATLALPADVAEAVDARVAPMAATIGMICLERLITAVSLEMGEPAPLTPATRRAKTRVPAGSLVGYLEATLDADVARRFEAEVARIAHALLEEGDDSELDERRARAFDVLANPLRHATIGVDPSTSTAALPHLHLHVNLTEAALTRDQGGIVDVEGIGPQLAATVRAWAGHDRVHVHPVIDAEALAAVDAYHVPTRMREAIMHRHTTCVFPGCQMRASRCDLDHIEAFRRGETGQTSLDNLAPLCRRHHRMKTHGRWRYRRLDPTHYLWTTPQGRQVMTGSSGTIAVTQPDPRTATEIRRLRDLAEKRWHVRALPSEATLIDIRIPRRCSTDAWRTLRRGRRPDPAQWPESQQA